MSIAEQIIGVWELVDWTVTLPEGRVSLPFGANPAGRLVYTTDETVHVHFMRRDRPRLPVDFGVLQQIRRYFLGIEAVPPMGVDTGLMQTSMFRAGLEFNAYCGTYSVAGDEVTHYVDIAAFPNWEGVALKRKVELDEDRLILSADAAGQADRLEWRRLKSGPENGHAD